VLIICLGILGVEIRSAPVIRPWNHLLLVGAGFCAFCAALYMALPVIINDTCDTQQPAIYAAIRSVDTSSPNDTWFKYFTEYYPILSTCVHGEFFINHVTLPSSVTDLLNQSIDINEVLGLNYTGLILNATQQLDQGMTNLDNVNISLLNATTTKAKLENVSAQLNDLSNFQFSMLIYNQTIANISFLTSSINTSYPNGTVAILSLFYTAVNMSLLQLDEPPYVYTAPSYVAELNASLNQFYSLNNTYTQLLALTKSIQNNITEAENMIDSLNSISTNFEVVKQQANASFVIIDQRADNITKIVSNLTNTVSSDLVPQLDIVNSIWGTITNMTDCGYVGDVYHDMTDLVCTTFLISAVAFVTTMLITTAILCILYFAGMYAYTSFRRPYKPFVLSYVGPPVDTLVAVESSKQAKQSKHKNPKKGKQKGKNNKEAEHPDRMFNAGKKQNKTYVELV